MASGLVFERSNPDLPDSDMYIEMHYVDTVVVVLPLLPLLLILPLLPLLHDGMAM